MVMLASKLIKINKLSPAEWTAKKQKALSLLNGWVTGQYKPMDYGEIAAIVGISRRTLYRWRLTEEFKAARREAWERVREESRKHEAVRRATICARKKGV